MQKDDVIYRQDAIDAVEESRRLNHHQDGKAASCHEYEHRHFIKILSELPSAQPETSRIENALHGKTPEEQYDFIWWLIQEYAMNFTDSRQAAIEWLKGEGNDQQ